MYGLEGFYRIGREHIKPYDLIICKKRWLRDARVGMLVRDTESAVNRRNSSIHLITELKRKYCAQWYCRRRLTSSHRGRCLDNIPNLADENPCARNRSPCAGYKTNTYFKLL